MSRYLMIIAAFRSSHGPSQQARRFIGQTMHRIGMRYRSQYLLRLSVCCVSITRIQSFLMKLTEDVGNRFGP